MCDLYERITALCKQKGVTGSRMCLELGLSKSTLSDIKSGRKKGLSTANAQKIASFLGVSIEYLLGKETEKAPTRTGERTVSDDDIKFALFGGDGEITDAMFDEVKQFAAMVKLLEDSKKKKE